MTMGSERVIRSPYDGREAGRVTVPSAGEVESAVAGARTVFGTTRRMPLYQRTRILRAVAESLLARREDLARTLADEAAKPLRFGRIEAERAAATFHAAAAAAEMFEGRVLSLDVNPDSAGRWGLLRRFPIGPVLAITPFNFPLNLTAHKVAPAIAVGAPVVQKPASQTPLCALALREMVLEAGWPEEAYSVLPLSGAVAEGLVRDPRLPVVSFTGSAPVGWRLKSLVPRKRVGLELGGNAAAIVHEDADIEDAAARCVGGAFAFAGQSCISLQRALVHEAVFDRFQKLVVQKAAAWKTGDPRDETTLLGPMISEEDAMRAQEWVNEAVSGGASLLSGGGRQGALLAPVILTGTEPGARVECEEIFAPVFTVNPYSSLAEAIERVNGSRYGLQAAVFTRDLGRIHEAFESIETGGVVVNDSPAWRADKMPYGGVKDSGTGREGPAFAMEEFTEMKILSVRLP
ncbi:MAG: aldehyde dehydrogenase family protein [Acidobacteria bacterium]|nr:aldehyde dehydrogenase family protein [Acidobacteriota bacterium]